MMKKNYLNNKGLTLIELIIAIFVISVGVVGTFGVLQKIVVSTSLSSSKLVAAYLAQEGIEIIRNIRDTNWVEGEDWDHDIASAISSYVDYRSLSFPDAVNCNNKEFLEMVDIGIPGTFYQCSFQGRFKRTIEIERIDMEIPALDGEEEIVITVTVEWQERGSNQEIVTQEVLYNWFRGND